MLAHSLADATLSSLKRKREGKIALIEKEVEFRWNPEW
jgi:hypothetical protein